MSTLLPTTPLQRLRARPSSPPARAPPHGPKPHLAALALKLCPAIRRAHARHEYEKDRARVREVYAGYQERRRRNKGGGDVVGGARGGGSVVDLRTYLAPVEWVPLERGRDPWWSEEVLGEGGDPWRLPPVGEVG
ncbi:hypothetical protein HO173_005892 [Letharia columbiana]|uniref:Uncharacterized protein n=1 Tax=Letharia columbiana TaxID=112416 RepID=A0A8H6FWT0_9LECA|nr:uncharacterized protein HO173_005892 [Letharia columbiana]KAF6236261.1 hypothetical protein HO173_005892 [Letharia columbiana]